MKLDQVKKYFELKESCLCPFCEKKVDEKIEFKDQISLREFRISGMCQQCQNSFFNEDQEVNYFQTKECPD